MVLLGSLSHLPTTSHSLYHTASLPHSSFHHSPSLGMRHFTWRRCCVVLTLTTTPTCCLLSYRTFTHSPCLYVAVLGFTTSFIHHSWWNNLSYIRRILHSLSHHLTRSGSQWCIAPLSRSGGSSWSQVWTGLPCPPYSRLCPNETCVMCRSVNCQMQADYPSQCTAQCTPHAIRMFHLPMGNLKLPFMCQN